MLEPFKTILEDASCLKGSGKTSENLKQGFHDLPPKPAHFFRKEGSAWLLATAGWSSSMGTSGPLRLPPPMAPARESPAGARGPVFCSPGDRAQYWGYC